MLGNYFRKKLEAKVARGIVVVDKEAGITSHDEVDRLRQIFETRKVGHSGTLDPKVTGVLVCGLGRGTKVLEYVLLSEKIYDCEIVFHQKVSQQDFEQVIDQFTGNITQLPPLRSRVKRIEREREVYGIELRDFASDGRSAQIRCAVERGTYIRKLCHDMGQVLGVGAHMGELRRIQAGPCRHNDPALVTTAHLADIKRKSRWPLFGWWYTKQLALYVQPIERILVGLPQVVVDEQLAKPLAAGADLFVPGVDHSDDYRQGDRVQIVTHRGDVLAVGIAQMSSADLAHAVKGVAVEVTKVITI